MGSGKNLEGAGEGEVEIRMYCMKKIQLKGMKGGGKNKGHLVCL